MSDPTQTTSQIADELLTEVKQELVRRGTTLIPKKPEPDKDTLASFAVSAILACLALLAGTGIAMALTYTPTVEDANASTAWFAAGTLGAIARSAHWHAANLLVLLSGAYLGYLLWKGLFRRPNQWRWWRAMALLGLVLSFSLTGQVLPFDQLAAHGTSIRLGYLAQAPLFGETLRELAQGGGSIGNGTLSRMFGMHAVVLPALSVILLRWLWRDTETEAPVVYTAAVAGTVVLLVGLVSVLFSAPLGPQGNLAEPYPEARPEWFGMPLYALLKTVPPGPAHLLILFVAPLLAVVVLMALPFVETVATQPARLRKPLQFGLIGVVAFLLIFSAVPIFQDMSADEGWFRKQSTEGIMTAMGPRNDALLNSAELPPADTHNLARDLMLLHEGLIGNYTDPIDDAGRAKWDELADKGVAAARRLLYAPDAATQVKAREELRQVCMDCHKNHDNEEVCIDPLPKVAAGGGRSVAEEFFFHQEALGALKPTTFEKTNSTKRMMDQAKYALRDILIEAGAASDSRASRGPNRSKQQALVDLRAVIEIIAGHYESNEGAFADRKKWDGWINDLRKATADLGLAKDAADAASRSGAVGKACEACHDGADDLTEPIEWRFQSLLKPE